MMMLMVPHLNQEVLVLMRSHLLVHREGKIIIHTIGRQLLLVLSAFAKGTENLWRGFVRISRLDLLAILASALRILQMQNQQHNLSLLVFCNSSYGYCIEPCGTILTSHYYSLVVFSLTMLFVLLELLASKWLEWNAYTSRFG